MLNIQYVLKELNGRAYKVQGKYMLLNVDKQKELIPCSENKSVIKSFFTLVLCRYNLNGHISSITTGLCKLKDARSPLFYS